MGFLLVATLQNKIRRLPKIEIFENFREILVQGSRLGGFPEFHQHDGRRFGNWDLQSEIWSVELLKLSINITFMGFLLVATLQNKIRRLLEIEIFANFRKFLQIFTQVRTFSVQISRISPGISQNVRELLKIHEFSRFFRKNLARKNVQNCEKSRKKLSI